VLAIVSDIHANHEALKAVLADIDRLGASEIICLGDVVGYGPSPAECLRIAQRRFVVTLCGNHEWAIMNEPLGFHRVARDAARWHRATLFPRWWSSKEKKDAWDFLGSLPTTHRRGKLLFVHASPSNPTEEYLLRTDLDEILHELGPKLTRAFEKTDWVTFIGHTHYPGVITDDARFLVPKDIEYRLELEEGRKYIVNVGSVGQPRDADNRSCYVTLDRGVIEYHRVEYDVQATYKKVIESGVLDRSLAERLLSGT
jgi:predicted phosphodiesterase